MRLEYRLVHRFMAGHDFREGVRALIIDKDKRPGGGPASWAEVTPADGRRPISPRCRTATAARRLPDELTEQRGHGMAAIGFIGLGNMGLPMARNLLRAGHRLRAFDLAAAQVAAAVAAGARRRRSVAEAAPAPRW